MEPNDQPPPEQNDPGTPDPAPAADPGAAAERLFPFALRSRILIIGRDTLRRSKSKLHFVLITTDIAANNKAEVLAELMHYPVVQHYTAADIERFFDIKGAKAIGFAKSGLAQSIYAALKPFRINKPVEPKKKSDSDSPPETVA